MQETAPHQYPGAKALIDLHTHHLTHLAETWRRVRTAGVEAPPTNDPNCESVDAVMQHVLSAARWYMIWICEALSLPDPEIESKETLISGCLYS